MESKTQSDEVTLDPQDWDAMRTLGHQMVDDMIDYLKTIRERPIWQKPPDEVRDVFSTALPEEPQGFEATYADFVENVLPYPMGNIHPRFWGWVMGNGTPYAAMAEMMAAAMNSNLGGGDHAAVFVEEQVIDWCKEMFNFPADASGLLTSGGSMANLVGLTVARNHKAGYNIREEGVAQAPTELVLYASAQTHSSNIKAAELLGLGRDALRLIPVNADYEIDIAALKATIAEDKAAERRPFCVIGHAGTVNTGAFDDLQALADIAEREDMWFHVDGAFGAFAAITTQSKHLAAGIDRADSLAFDMHKWMYLPYEIGCTLVKHEEAHRYAFSLTPEYLEHSDRGLNAGKTWFSDYGIQLTRGFRALKAWMTIKAEGMGKFRQLIQQNIDQASYVYSLIEEHPLLENMAPAPSNIVCFRYNDGQHSDDALNAINRELLIRLHEEAVAIPTYTTLNGHYVLRIAITNHRSRREDFAEFVDEAVALAQVVAGEVG